MSVIFWTLCVVFGLFQLCTCQDHTSNPKGSLDLDKYLHLNWQVNSTKKTIRFTVKANISPYGWFLIGFAPQQTLPKQPKLLDIQGKGDAFVVWRQQDHKLVWKLTDCNTINGSIHKDKKNNYHFHLKNYNENESVLAVNVWRHLDTKDNENIKIEPGPVVVFISIGNEDKNSTSKKWKDKLKKIEEDEIDDYFKTFENVDFFKVKTKKPDSNLASYAANIAEKHWIGLVIGVSAFLTVLITCTVYCVSRKGNSGFTRKRVTMSFHKDNQYDDEAKVAFLQSEDT